MYKFFFITLSLFIMNSSYSHPAGNDPAATYLEYGQYSEAAEWLKQEYSRRPADILALRIGEAYTLNKEYTSALLWFDKAGSIETADSSRFLLLKGDALLGTGEYDKAKDIYTLFAGLTGDQTLVVDRLASLDQLKRATDLSEGWALENLPCNTSADEWTVTNFRTRELIISNQKAPEGADHSAWFDFFTLEREFDKWLPPKPLMKPEDETHNRIGVTFSRDGNYVYFVQVEKEEPLPVKKGKGAKAEEGMAAIKTTLYSAAILGNQLSDIQPLPFNQGTYRIKDPCIDATGTLLFFAAEMPGGYGGFDIYVARNINGRWILPENLGSSINSPYDDFAPYVRQDKADPSLYFSSTRPYGFGGADLYKSTPEKNKYIRAEILPPPLNSSGDEYSIMFDGDKMSGYLTSNRAGGKGGFDVYRFTPYSLTILVNVKDTLQQPVGFASVSLNNTEAVTDKTGKVMFTAQPGKEYNMRVNCQDYDPTTVQVSTKGHNLFDTIPMTVTLRKAFHSKISIPQFVDLHITIRDKAGKVIPGTIFTVINLQNSRVRNLQADDNGLLEQVLLPESDYRFIMVEDGYNFSEKISTRGIAPGSLMSYELILDKGIYTFKRK